MPATLQILIATCRPDGIIRVSDMQLPQLSDVEYIVMWQLHNGGDVPDNLMERNDISVMRSDRVGLSANRNDLLRVATAPIVLIADDDLVYSANDLENILKIFRENPDVDIFAFKHRNPNKKFYPKEECLLNKPIRHYYPTSYELAIRRNKKTHQLLFREDFGIGAPYFGSGEEDLLLIHARRMGLNCRFFPIEVTTHPGISTGHRQFTTQTLHSRAAIATLNHKWTWPARVLLIAWRLRSLKSVAPLFGAAIKVTLHRKEYLDVNK